VAEHHQKRNSAIQRVALVLTCAIAFALLAPPRAANAQDAFSCIEELTDDEVQYRIRFIEGKLQDGKKHAARWRYSWMGVYLALGGVTTYLAIDANNDNNDADYFGWGVLSLSFYAGALLSAAIPAPDVWGAKRIRRMDGSTDVARQAKLLYATETLKKANNVQGFAAGPLGIVGGLTFGVVVGSIKATQWKGQSPGLTAALYIVPPFIAGIQNATAPREAMSAYESYRGIACSSHYYQQEQDSLDFDFSAGPGGARFGIAF